MTTFTWDELGDGAVLWTMDDPGASTNTINPWFLDALRASIDAVRSRDDVTGVVLTSGKRTFSAGGDLAMMRDAGPADAERITAYVNDVKAQLRRLEQLGVPVVAALNGAALGGGFELALCCHRRIAAEEASVGLPEITLGLLPGGGGVTRTVRLLGLQTALDRVLMTGRSFRAPDALELGLVDEVVPVDSLLDAARSWLATAPDPVQPWDRAGYAVPGGAPSTSRPSLDGLLPTLPAALRKRTRGAPATAQRNLLCAAVEGAAVDLDTALRVETSYCVELICGQESTNVITTSFFGTQSIAKGASRPAGPAEWRATKVAVLGAGMMGAGIAHSAARAGLDVVLLDQTLEAAQRGKEHATARGADPDRITATDTLDDVKGADLVIEAVFEDLSLKQRLLADVEPLLAPDALLASNTSTLPITQIATAVARPADVVGLHFFSPVDRMPLVEIVVGQQTSDDALARAFDLVRQLRKTPIVVNDSRGFFTSRVIIRFLLEAAAMLAEGVAAATVEQAGQQAGYPAAPLSLIDELAMPLMLSIRDEARAAGVEDDHPGYGVLETMVALGRPSRAGGGGFYHYADGARTGLWPGLRATFPPVAQQPPLADLVERMLYAEALEAQRCLAEGVVRTVEDANVGSLLGIGFPAWTGGVLQYVEHVGADAFAARARQLAAQHGDRFLPPTSDAREQEHR